MDFCLAGDMECTRCTVVPRLRLSLHVCVGAVCSLPWLGLALLVSLVFKTRAIVLRTLEGLEWHASLCFGHGVPVENEFYHPGIFLPDFSRVSHTQRSRQDTSVISWFDCACSWSHPRHHSDGHTLQIRKLHSDFTMEAEPAKDLIDQPPFCC